jgi:selenide,water dikinase
MQRLKPIAKDLVLVGGGHTHSLVLRRWAMHPLPSVRLTLITNLVDTPYSGMLPCHISGLYDFDTAHIDLRPLTRFAGCQLVMDRAVGIDGVNQQVYCADHPPIAYDVLSIDTGSTPATATVPGAREYAIPAKPVPELLRAWEDWLSQLRQVCPASITLAVVGGGVGGVELAMNMQVRLWTLMDDLGRSRQDVILHLFHRGGAIAHGRNRSTQRLLTRQMQNRGIQLHLQESVCEVTVPTPSQRLVRCESGLAVKCDRVFWVTHAAAPDWLQSSGLTTDSKGFLLVEDTLQSVSHPNIFAAGDVATMKNYPRPKAGVFAVRQGPPLFHNLQALLQGKPLRPFRPQRQYLNIIDTGDGSAIASRGICTVASPLMRAWKDRIDRKFMRLFTDFPEMPHDRSQRLLLGLTDRLPLDPQPMYCAGCGSKVGSDVLRQSLQRWRQATVNSGEAASPGVVVGLDTPDDAAIVQVPPGQLLVHSVDYFSALVDDPFVLAQIVVKHGLNDLYAMGATPHSVLAIATLPYALPDKQAETLFQLLSGLQKALSPSQTPLVGGHTNEGPELALGLACNGTVTPSQLLHKGGMQVGDGLILTQPLGTGTLFAADMRYAAKGRWIENAIAHMRQPSAAALHCLQQHGVTACTDVTGFGLLGHLAEMVQASQVSVELDLRSLPLLWGAGMTLAQGHLSSLQSQNQRAMRFLRQGETYAHRTDFPILFDPQTAGGLLATVPGDRAAACVTALHQLGYAAAASLGTVVPEIATVPPITIKAW